MYGILKLDTRKMFPPQHLIKITFSTCVLGVIVHTAYSVLVKLIRSLLSFPTIHQASMDNSVFPLTQLRIVFPSHRFRQFVLLINWLIMSFSSIDWLIDWSSIISMLQDLYINPSVGLVFKFCERRDRVYQCKTKLKIFRRKKTFFFFLKLYPELSFNHNQNKKKVRLFLKTLCIKSNTDSYDSNNNHSICNLIKF